MARGWLRSVGLAAAGAALLPAAGLLHAAGRVAPCDRTELTASIGDNQTARRSTHIARPHDHRAGRRCRLQSAPIAKVDAKGLRRGKQVTAFSYMLGGIADDIDGDLAFLNLETVVTDRNDLAPEGKGKDAFHFRSHPAALKALINHRLQPVLARQQSCFRLWRPRHRGDALPCRRRQRRAGHRLCRHRRNFDEAIKPGCVDVDGTKIGLSAIGIITGDQPQYRAGPNSPGQASYRDRADFEAVVDKLAAMPADYRILSIHYGLEGRVIPDDRQLDDWRKFAAEEKGIDLIVGHHPHVAQGVELDGKSLIFYGLGNFLHPGTAEMTRFGICRDYGLMAKVHLARIDGAWKVEAIETIPLTNTQIRPARFSAPEAEKRIYALNHLSAGLDDDTGKRGVRFTPQADGSGLYCADGAAALGGKIGTLCTGWQPAAEPDQKLAARIDAACEDKPFYDKPSLVRRRVPQAR